MKINFMIFNPLQGNFDMVMYNLRWFLCICHAIHLLLPPKWLLLLWARFDVGITVRMDWVFIILKCRNLTESFWCTYMVQGIEYDYILCHVKSLISWEIFFFWPTSIEEFRLWIPKIYLCIVDIRRCTMHDAPFYLFDSQASTDDPDCRSFFRSHHKC